MTKKEIATANLLIAIFDGWKHSGKGGNLSRMYYQTGRISNASDFLYHRSWDWLMPACRKFDVIYKGKSKRWHDKKYKQYQALCDEIDHCVTLYEINGAFKALTKAIVWYNKSGK